MGPKTISRYSPFTTRSLHRWRHNLHKSPRYAVPLCEGDKHTKLAWTNLNLLHAENNNMFVLHLIICSLFPLFSRALSLTLFLFLCVLGISFVGTFFWDKKEFLFLNQAFLLKKIVSNSSGSAAAWIRNDFFPDISNKFRIRPYPEPDPQHCFYFSILPRYMYEYILFHFPSLFPISSIYNFCIFHPFLISSSIAHWIPSPLARAGPLPLQ